MLSSRNLLSRLGVRSGKTVRAVAAYAAVFRDQARMETDL
jgi:hypothetical protein